MKTIIKLSLILLLTSCSATYHLKKAIAKDSSIITKEVIHDSTVVIRDSIVHTASFIGTDTIINTVNLYLSISIKPDGTVINYYIKPTTVSVPVTNKVIYNPTTRQDKRLDYKLEKQKIKAEVRRDNQQQKTNRTKLRTDLRTTKAIHSCTFLKHVGIFSLGVACTLLLLLTRNILQKLKVI